ncbi:hypothetical protein [Anaerococcus sp. AGMB09787]|uniref:hypothetical protein n=1 Tax=Anaerococcus sp. AGMB09787 TaxID=2922869 RepID=UPI001FAEAA19|nr:hypothetical protein [Anaerococcus sp. AGMB09787]
MDDKMKKNQVEGVIITKWGSIFIPNEEYEKKGLKRLTRDGDKVIPVGKKEKNGDSVMENAIYYPDENKIVVTIDLD